MRQPGPRVARCALVTGRLPPEVVEEREPVALADVEEEVDEVRVPLRSQPAAQIECTTGNLSTSR